MVGSNLPKGADLGRVVMPIIRVMCAGGLSWSNKEDCAAAIQEAYRHWKSMEDERRAHEQNEMIQKLTRE